jgi:DNA relaxase NicK
MIRLSLEFFEDKVQSFITWLNNVDTYKDGIEIKHWVSFKEFSYKNMFHIALSDCNFVFAIGFNGNSEDRYKGFIEFNPNKCMNNLLFREILAELFLITFRRQVSRFDLAIDIPCPKYLVSLEKDGRNYQYLKGKQSESEYLGIRNKSGFVKLYDKKAESNLNYDLTRLEITTDGKDINFPCVKIKKLQQSLLFGDLSSTERVLVQLLDRVNNKEIYLNQLNYRKRKKIVDYLGEEVLQLDKNAYYKIRGQALQFQC